MFPIKFVLEFFKNKKVFIRKKKKNDIWIFLARPSLMIVTRRQPRPQGAFSRAPWGRI